MQGVTDCFKRVVSEEGVLALWRGNVANVARYFPTQALNFAFKDKIKATFHRDKADGVWAWYFSNLAAGGVAGALSLCFVYPLDYARTRLANDKLSAKLGGTRQFEGMQDVLVKTVKSDGFLGLYRGFVVSCVGIILYRGTYFGMYDNIKDGLPAEMKSSFAANFGLGYVITTGAGVLSYPLDTIRRRMMMTAGEAVKYDSSIDAARHIYREGATSFFKGAGANILRGIAGAGVLAGFDHFKVKYLEWRFEQEEAAE